MRVVARIATASTRQKICSCPLGAGHTPSVPTQRATVPGTAVEAVRVIPRQGSY